MSRIIHLVAVLLLVPLALPRTSFASPQATAEKAGALQHRIDAFLQRCTEAGFHGSVLVVRDDQALLDRGYGLRDRERSLPNGPNTVHAIGSLTKQFTAAAILKLQEMDSLRVTDAMSEYLLGVPEDKAAITLHHLLTHSAGFPGAIGDDYAPVERSEFLELALATPLSFEPGEGYEYSNVGYSLLGAIVEIASGRGYEQFLKEELLEPAGLEHTGYQLPDWSGAELAIGYDARGERWGTMLDHPWAPDGPYWHLRCNGGLLSSTHDMLAWLDALRRHTVLGPAAVSSMLEPHVAEGEGADSHYGYGWAVFETPRGTRLITHNGGNGIQFADVLWYADEGVSIALMSNASARGMQDLAWEIGRMCFDPTYEPSPPRPARRLSGLPEGPAGDRLRAISDVLASGADDAALRTWLKENLGPGFLEDVPMERHVAVFRRLCTDIGAHRIESVEEQGPDEYVLHLCSARDGALYRIDVQLRPSDARIGGLGVELE